MITEKYTIKKELGKGAYGTVYLAVDNETEEEVAIKRIDDVFRTKVDAKRALREIVILRHCHHPNICGLTDLIIPPDQFTYRNLWMVQEYGGWDLSRVLRNSKRISNWGEAHVRSIMYQLMCGLLYLQSGNIVHRDLKPSNILINSKCDIKIIDFGLARQIGPQYKEHRETRSDIADAGIQVASTPQRQLTQHVVTRWYRAPELILMQEYYSSAIDMWSAGCIFAELLQTLEPGMKAQPLFPGKTCFPLSARRNERQNGEKLGEEFRAETHQLMKIFDVIGTPSREDVEGLDEGPMKEFLMDLEPIDPVDYSYIFPSASDEALQLLQQMLTFNPKKRISVKKALRLPFFSNIRKEEKEIVMEERIPFPFEYDSISTETEMLRLRRLIYHEAVEFK